MNKIYGIAIAICVIVVLATFAGIINESLKPSRGSPNFSAFVVYNPYVVSGHNPKNNWTQFLADLDCIKDLGFKGVKLHSVRDFWWDGILENATRAMYARNLSVIIQLQYFGPEQFPQNTTHTDTKLNTMKKVAEQLKDEDGVLWYALLYPWYSKDRFNYIKNNMTDPMYKSELQRIINEIGSVDSNHPIYLVSDAIEYWAENYTVPGVPPTNFENITGYGYMPYSRIEDNIQWNEILLKYYNFYESKCSAGQDVYVDEWGVQTVKCDSGKASSETMKCQMIRDFACGFWKWDIVWCYFALHDRIDADWGLVYDNNALKESGKTMKKLLAGQNEEDFSDSDGLYLIASVVVGVSALAILVSVLVITRKKKPMLEVKTETNRFSKTDVSSVF